MVLTARLEHGSDVLPTRRFAIAAVTVDTKRPSKSPAAIARKIQTVRYRSMYARRLIVNSNHRPVPRRL